MEESQLEFVMPSLADAIPIIVVIILLPAWLIIVVFKYTKFSKAIRINSQQ